jgi:hypothetical protein
MNPQTLYNPFNYQPIIDTSYYQGPTAAASVSPLVSLANGIGDLFDNGLNIYASTLNRFRALDIINNDSKQQPATTAGAAIDSDAKVNNLILMLILAAVSVGLFIWISRK